MGAMGGSAVHGWPLRRCALGTPIEGLSILLQGVIKHIFDRLLSKYNHLDLSKVIANENYVKIIVICAIPMVF